MSFEWDGNYPVRARIVDADGHPTPVLGLVCATPDASRQHIGREGIAHLINAFTVRIDLDGGGVIWGHDCWWEPIGPVERRDA